MKLVKTSEVAGTQLMGTVAVNYKELVQTFGEPHEIGDKYKTDAEWAFETEFGTVTIYNYKDGKAYLDEEGLETSQITNWHVGGHNKSALTWVLNLLNNPKPEPESITLTLTEREATLISNALVGIRLKDKEILLSYEGRGIRQAMSDTIKDYDNIIEKLGQQ